MWPNFTYNFTHNFTQFHTFRSCNKSILLANLRVRCHKSYIREFIKKFNLHYRFINVREKYKCLPSVLWDDTLFQGLKIRFGSHHMCFRRRPQNRILHESSPKFLQTTPLMRHNSDQGLQITKEWLLWWFYS